MGRLMGGKFGLGGGSRSLIALIAVAWLALGGCTLVPHPLTDAERTAEASLDRAEMFAGQEPLRHPLTLHEAFARALRYNLDGRVKLHEEALARDDLDLSRYDLLPKVYGNVNYTSRNNDNAASAVSSANGAQTLPPSFSTDRNDLAADLLVSFNLVDFGVSYYAARQQTDRVLIGDEERRKVIQTLFQDIRRAFWRAASAQQLGHQIKEAIAAAEAALPAARKVETEGLRSPVDSLRYQKALLELISQLENIEGQLAVSKSELAQLINLPPGQPYSLAVPGSMRADQMRMSMARMEETALLFNPDIRELSYQKRISIDDTRKALLRLLPGVTLSYDPSYDSNSFLVNHYWATGAARLNGYLNNLLTFPVVYRRATEAEHLADLKREAMSIAVLAKLHIAYEQYLFFRSQFRRAQEVAEVDQRLYDQIRNRSVTDVGGDLDRISAQVSAATSELQRYQSYAEMQAALGRLYAAVGVDPMPQHFDVLDIEGVARAIRKAEAEQARRTTTLDTAGSSAEVAAPVVKGSTLAAPAQDDSTANAAPVLAAVAARPDLAPVQR
jgi:outer membrane protein TolC